MQATKTSGRARRLIASVTLASVVALGGVLVPCAYATVADGDVQLGAQARKGCVPGTVANCETTTTAILNVSAGSEAFDAIATGGGSGIYAQSDTGIGVAGNTNSSSYGAVQASNGGGGPGVIASSSTGGGLLGLSASSNGVHGLSSGSTQSGVWGENTAGGYGVSGSTSSTGGSAPAGVWGSNANSGPGVIGTSAGGRAIFGSSTTGQGVFGQGQTGVEGSSSASNGEGLSGQASSPSGVGVLASNPSGQGLKVTGGSTFGGSTTFARSGKLTIPAGGSQATKSSISLSSASLVMTTIQGNVAGVYVQGATTVNGSSGSFTVHLNKTTPTALTVAWLIAN